MMLFYLSFLLLLVSGLLLPKIVVDDFGGNRSDQGCLDMVSTFLTPLGKT